MSALAYAILLALALLALGEASVRIASLAAPSGLDRGLAAAALAATAAALEALGLGLAGLGTSPLGLAAAAALTWLAARRWVPAPDLPLLTELARAWQRLGPAGRAVAGALAGGGVLAVAWLLRSPYIGIDALAYHIPEVVSWVHNGHPGAIELLTYDFPVGNYPLTNEVLVAWLAGISRSFSALMLWTPAALALLALAAWAGLRGLAVPRLPAALAVAAVCTLPMVTGQLEGPNTDLPALAWLVTAGALTVAATRPRGHAALLAFALLAAGLAAGTKTTTVPFAALAVGAGLVVRRGELRRLAPWLAIAALAALIAGGAWYFRNLFDHGSPLWPFVSTPWGDPLPPFLDRIDVSFLDRPGATLEGRTGEYWDVLVGGAVLLAGGLGAWLLDRRRAVLAACATTALGAVVWANAPFTGAPDDPAFVHLAISASRYLLPTIATATLALALAGGGRGWGARIASLVLAAAVAVNVVTIVDRGYPYLPSLPALLAAAPAGALAALLVGTLADRRGGGTAPGARARALVAGVAAAIVAATLALSANGIIERYVAAGSLFSPLVGWFEDRPDFREGEQPVGFAPVAVGALAGERLDHALALVPADEPCPAVEERTRAGWVVTREASLLEPVAATECLAGERAEFEWNGFRVSGEDER